jgi:hypothetical protein
MPGFIRKPYFEGFTWLARNYPMSSRMFICSVEWARFIMKFHRKKGVLKINKIVT